MNTGKTSINELAERVIGRALAVSNGPGAGFPEKIFENALAHELRKAGLRVEQQEPVKVYDDGVVMGTYVADLVVESVLVVELKAVRALDAIHTAQCLNYLRATGSGSACC
jgi:GxxExxY protein